MAELELQLESAHHESQDWVAEVIATWAEGQRVAERATIAEWGLEVAKAH